MAKNVEDLYRDEHTKVFQSLTMTIKLPPSQNHMYVNNGRGGRTLSKSAKKYLAELKAWANMIVEEQAWELQDDSTWYYVDMVFYFPDRRKRDSHNQIKLLLDGLEGIVYVNDRYVLPRIQAVEYDKTNPRLELLITPQTKKERKKALKNPS